MTTKYNVYAEDMDGKRRFIAQAVADRGGNGLFDLYADECDDEEQVVIVPVAVTKAARALGSMTSPAKKASSRANGKLGGRPREKNRALSHRIIVDKIDTGNEYPHLDRYQEMDKPELPRVGVTYLVWVSEYVGPNRMQHTPSVLHFSNDERMVNEGFPGNSDHTVRRFHGWRGTTDDYAIHAMGVRECVGVECIDHQKTVHYRISFSPDLKFDQD